MTRIKINQKLNFLEQSFSGDLKQLNILSSLNSDEKNMVFWANSDLIFLADYNDINTIIKLYRLGFIKIGHDIPICGEPIDKIYEAGEDLKKFDLSPEELSVKLIEIIKDSEVRHDNSSLYSYIMVASYKPWHLDVSTIDYPRPICHSLSDLIKYSKSLNRYYSANSFFFRFDNVDEARKKFIEYNLKLGFIKYIGFDNSEQLIHRSKQKICDDLLFSDEIFNHIYSFIKDKEKNNEDYFEADRFIISESNYEWPNFGMPSHYRLEYSDKIIEGNI